nr:cold-shock protein [Roseicella aerolata]
MAKNDSWRPRKPRKRGFDDDTPEFGGGGWGAPPPFPMPSSMPASRGPSVFATGPEIEATVKWFNPEKGFGFVELGNGSGDAFLHISVLQRSGQEAVNPGAGMRVRVGPGQKGQQVTEVVEITSPGEPGGPGGGAPRGGFGDRPPRSGGFGDRPRGGGGGFAPSGPAEEMRGTVKWYSAEKGFGFVSPEGGGRDVFVHATALERSGLSPLTEGQAVVMQVVQGKKGPEASTLTRA